MLTFRRHRTCAENYFQDLFEPLKRAAAAKKSLTAAAILLTRYMG
jgi:hypothetical protein